MSAEASLALTSGSVQLSAGGQAVLTAVVGNPGAAPEDYRLGIRGMDPTWVTFRPPALALEGGEQRVVSVLVSAPANAPGGSFAPVLRLYQRRTGMTVAE